MRAALVAIGLMIGCGEEPPADYMSTGCTCHHDPQQLLFSYTLFGCRFYSVAYPLCDTSHDIPPPNCFSIVPGDTRPCGGPCMNLDEAQCSAAPTCGVARQQDAYYTGSASFLGCFELSGAGNTTCSTTNAIGCAATKGCTPLYDQSYFVECVDAATVVGTCSEPVTCPDPRPPCPADRTPGVANGCYTGSCIPTALCN